jgi:exodeoxyribonuclease V alpha subunit
MNHTQNEFPLNELEGIIERITFQNEENGYMVARFIPKGEHQEVTLVGTLTGVNVGEAIKIRGVWGNHPLYGKQFEVREFTIILPSSIEGIRRYLGSGLIKGVGPVTATRIVDHFGIKSLDIIENSPQRLLEVPKIGPKRTEMITQAWEEQKQIKEIMVFLQSYSISTSLAIKIYKQYGNNAISIVRNNPYQLARDIYGVGFKTADKIARQLGLPQDAPSRIQAGILYSIGSESNDGHCFVEKNKLLLIASKLLEVDSPSCSVELENLIKQREVEMEDNAIYLPPFLIAERSVATKINSILTSPRDRLAVFNDVNWQAAFEWLDQTNKIQLTDQQKKAIQMSLTAKISILTGGPGTGKSTITGTIIRMIQSKGCSVLLAAPTGRAAKRLTEATGLTAKTIHRLLEFSPSSKDHFQRDKENPLDADLIIIDETSMVDILLMHHLMSALDIGSHILFVGDADQLPSVGPGNVLKDMIDSNDIPVTRLDTIFRQAENSYIILNAHRINQGQFPIFDQKSRDFFLFNESEPEKAADWVLDIVTHRIPTTFGYRPESDIQVLSPMHRGPAGVRELNLRLQEALNPAETSKPEYKQGFRSLRSGDRIMQIRNNYDLQVFNGDLGMIQNIDLEDQNLIVNYDNRFVSYDFSQLDELIHAYAISIHKAQGSEFKVVVIPILTQHYMMLQRNLLYTGITRAREMVVLVGNKKAITIAVNNDRPAQRNTRLAMRI